MRRHARQRVRSGRTVDGQWSLALNALIHRSVSKPAFKGGLDSGARTVWQWPRPFPRPAAVLD
eukprot:1353829-Lingulodinium_polyedra.AAC.1